MSCVGFVDVVEVSLLSSSHDRNFTKSMYLLLLHILCTFSREY